MMIVFRNLAITSGLLAGAIASFGSQSCVEPRTHFDWPQSLPPHLSKRAIGEKLLCGRIDGWERFSNVPPAAALEYDAGRCAHVVVISGGAR